MFSNYVEILRLPGALKFCLSGFFLRLPMSMVSISIVLLVKAEYGNYTLAGAMSAVSVLALAASGPFLARLVDQKGQRRIMLPTLMVSAMAMACFIIAAVVHMPEWILFLFAMISGATWGSPGALVRARWSKVVTGPKELNTAYALEAALDEMVFIIGPIAATILGTLIHPSVGLVLSCIAIVFGSLAFFSQTDSEPLPRPKQKNTKRPSVMRNPVMIVLALTVFGAGSMFGATDVATIAFTQEHGAPEMAGIILGIYAVGSFISAIIYGSRTWMQPLWILFAGGVILLAIGSTTFLFAHSLPLLALVMCITGFTISPTMTNVNSIVTKVVHENQLTEGLTWIGTAISIGVSVGSSIAGFRIDAGGAREGFFLVVLFAWVMVILMLIGLTRVRQATVQASADEHERLLGNLEQDTLTDNSHDGQNGDTDNV